MYDRSLDRNSCRRVCNFEDYQDPCFDVNTRTGKVFKWDGGSTPQLTSFEDFLCLRELVPEVLKTPVQASEICKHFGVDAPGSFQCTKTTSNDALPTTHDEAVTYYKKNYAPDALCAPLKENAPFQCTGSEPKSAVEILSLSFSNTELALSVFGTLFVFILYKCKKAEKPSFLQEDELVAKLEKLEKAIERLEGGDFTMLNPARYDSAANISNVLALP